MSKFIKLHFFDSKINLWAINNLNYIKPQFKNLIYVNPVLYKYNITFFTKTFTLYWIRMTWKGKAYRVRLYKKYNKFTLNFGYSHWYKLIISNIRYKIHKIKKQNYLFFFFKNHDKYNITTLINNIKVINKYTKRGLRVKKSPYLKRFGKISQI